MRTSRVVRIAILLALLAAAGPGAQSPPVYHTIIRNGTIYDGTGADAMAGDLAIDADSIVGLGDLGKRRGREEIDATGLVVAPGFINMLSHAEESLIEDPHSQSDIRQGVTLEVFGETSMGPVSEAMRKEWLPGAIKYDVTWATLGGYLGFLEQRGITPNVASFVGAMLKPRSDHCQNSPRSPFTFTIAMMRFLGSLSWKMPQYDIVP